MPLRVLYRTVAGDNTNPRPDFYSKELCAASLLRAVLEAEEDDKIELRVLQDGPDRAAALTVFSNRGTVEVRERRGNGPSWQAALDIAVTSSWSDEDIVYFVEDDYLHHRSAVRALLAAFRELPPVISYLTLYDHPDLYGTAGGGAASYAYVAGHRHWRTVTSTCMTFAARAGTLRADRAVLSLAGDLAIPSDHLMWLALQGQLPERALLAQQQNLRRLRLLRRLERVAVARVRRRPQSRARLATTLPGLATHLDLRDGLSPVVDWCAIAIDTAAWWEAARTSRLG